MVVPATPSWSPIVATLRHTMRKAVHEIAEAIKEEDGERWKCCGGRTLLPEDQATSNASIAGGSVVVEEVHIGRVGLHPLKAATTEDCHRGDPSVTMMAYREVPLAGREPPSSKVHTLSW